MPRILESIVRKVFFISDIKPPIIDSAEKILPEKCRFEI